MLVLLAIQQQYQAHQHFDDYDEKADTQERDHETLAQLAMRSIGRWPAMGAEEVPTSTRWRSGGVGMMMMGGGSTHFLLCCCSHRHPLVSTTIG